MDFDLTGTVLEGGWTLDKALPRPGEEGAEGLTGSYFSLGYTASNGKKRAFVKVIDVGKALKSQSGSSMMQRLKLVSDSHNFECSILDVCTRAKLDRVVSILGHGELPPHPKDPMQIALPYIVFELADGDVRKIISRTNSIDDVWRFKVLHNIATGLQQLHGQEIAHQDLKPSNVLIFDEANDGAKIGDLGRASKKHLDVMHDGFDIPGALAYAPPEQVYGIRPERWQDRREACDLYQLGTLLTFMFSGATPTEYFIGNLDKSVLPQKWRGKGHCDYETALPILQAAMTSFVDSIQEDFPPWAKDELKTIVLNACNPDYSKRGDPGARQRTGNPIGIEVFISKFDRLATQASIEARKP